MTYKKNRLSYILWFIYTCITGVMLANYTMLIWKKQINSIPQIYIVGFVFLFFALVVGLYFLLKKALSPVLLTNKIHEHTSLMWEIFAVLGIFAIGILYRIYLCLQSGAGGIVETNFYQMALVRVGNNAQPLVHGASYLYVQFLSLVFSFLGNKIMPAVWTQILIQMISILLVYFVIRKMIGRISACVVMFILAISTVYASQILMLTPETLFFLLYLIGFFITGSYVESYCRNRLSNLGKIWGAVFSGIVIGILAYLDAISLTLLIILVGLITGVHVTDMHNNDTYDAHDRFVESKRRKVVSVLLFILSAAACAFAIVGAFLLDSYTSKDSFEIVCNAWIKLYTGQPWIKTEIIQNNYSLAAHIVQVVFAALLVPAFLSNKELQNSTPWMCLMFVLAPVPLSTVGVLSYQVFNVFIWSVLAGLGLQQSLVTIGVEDKDENVEAEKFEAVEKLAIVGTGNIAVNAVPNNAASPVAQNVLTAPAVTQKPRFIENPLPLPKKHEKRELDYQYFVPEHKMKFDIEVAENDDFDI